ncbi:MAG: SPOR domain-containing protein [Cyclobacteriaceae bacterium]|nr:SPOR domain-containing protein [Cyclobacteriaceae bacterium]
MRLVFLILLTLMVAFCVQAQRNSSRYYEDLSVFRPRFWPPLDTPRASVDPALPEVWGAPKFTVNEKVNLVLDSINRFNLTRKFLDGYTILLYSGSSRESAMETKKKVTTELPDFVTTLQYNQPKFRLTAGAYFTRLEAEKDLYRLRRFLPTAILVPEKIPMR